MRSLRLKRLTAAHQAEVDASLSDPGLLDPRRPLALAETILLNTALLPSDEIVLRHARRMLSARLNPDLALLLRSSEDDRLVTLLNELLTPDEHDMEIARIDLHERSLRMVSTYARRQVDAVKVIAWGEVIRETALPLFGELGLKLSAVLKQYVPAENLNAAIEAVTRRMESTIGELAELRDA